MKAKVYINVRLTKTEETAENGIKSHIIFIKPPTISRTLPVVNVLIFIIFNFLTTG